MLPATEIAHIKSAMCFIRRLVVLLLVATLPIHGLAAVGAACPAQAAHAMDHAMGHSGHGTMDADGDHAMAGHDCCDPAAQPDQPIDSSHHAGGDCGKSCCHVYQPPVTAAVALMHPASETVLVQPVLPFVSHDAKDFWRPPRFV